MHLNEKIIDNFKLTKAQKSALDKLKLFTINDLILWIPVRYEDISASKTLSEIINQDSAEETEKIQSVYCEIISIEKKLNWKTKKYFVEAIIKDNTDKIEIKWFNQPYIYDKLKYVKYIKVMGRPTYNKKNVYFANPNIEPLPELPTVDEHNNKLYPIYRSSSGISSRWFYYAIKKILLEIDIEQLNDPIPEHILNNYNLPDIQSSVQIIHNPRNLKSIDAIKKRFAFAEVFLLQLQSELDKINRKKEKAYTFDKKSLSIENTQIKNFINNLGFKLTNSQYSAVNSILSDMSSNGRMSRLLEGDVGSGKTAVAMIAAYAMTINKTQVAYMAPTSVLANQIFNNFIKYFKNTNIKIGLITSKMSKKFPSKTNKEASTKISKSQLTKWIQDGTVNIIVGTHSLIQDTINFKNLSLVIIDEQHRFGTKQRQILADTKVKKDIPPHLLSMTATPIPRTLALTIYSSLDISVITEMPTGRKKVITKIINSSKINSIYKHIQEEINSGHQAYVICPKVTMSDLTTEDGPPSIQKIMMARLKNVNEETEKLRSIFNGIEIDSLHGKLSQQEKDDAMKRFANNETKILVATSVIEVGIDVPNATIILIEGAERFGLSQLHQLRGRVARGTNQSYCYLSTTNQNISENTTNRLHALLTAKNGFELAEMDLKLRGAGELSGDSQWGETDIAMEALKNIKMVEYAKESAKELINADPTLSKYKILKNHIKYAGKIHLE